MDKKDVKSNNCGNMELGKRECGREEGDKSEGGGEQECGRFVYNE